MGFFPKKAGHLLETAVFREERERDGGYQSEQGRESPNAKLYPKSFSRQSSIKWNTV